MHKAKYCTSQWAWIFHDLNEYWRNDIAWLQKKYSYECKKYCNLIVINKKNECTHREKVADSIGRVRDVKISPDGYIYIGVENKGIFKLVPKKWD